MHSLFTNRGCIHSVGGDKGVSAPSDRYQEGLKKLSLPTHAFEMRHPVAMACFVLFATLASSATALGSAHNQAGTRPSATPLSPYNKPGGARDKPILTFRQSDSGQNLPDPKLQDSQDNRPGEHSSDLELQGGKARYPTNHQRRRRMRLTSAIGVLLTSVLILSAGLFCACARG